MTWPATTYFKHDFCLLCVHSCSIYGSKDELSHIEACCVKTSLHRSTDPNINTEKTRKTTNDIIKLNKLANHVQKILKTACGIRIETAADDQLTKLETCQELKNNIGKSMSKICFIC